MEKPEQGRRNIVISSVLFETILATIPSPDFHDLLVVCWETGCRPQEIVRVEARHVDIGKSRWVFPANEAKGKKRIRCVYLTPAALEIMRKRMATSPTGPLFRNADGEPWHRQAIACAFKCVQLALGLQELKRRKIKLDPLAIQRLAEDLRRRGRDQRRGRPLSDKGLLGVARRRLLNEAATKLGPMFCLYNLRHSWATRALESGVDGVTVSVLMGHVDTRMLSRVYQHLSHYPQNLQQAVRRAQSKAVKCPLADQVFENNPDFFAR